MKTLSKLFASNYLAPALLVTLAVPVVAQTKEPTINIRRDGKVISVYLPRCADFCGFVRNFDLSGPSSLLGDRGPLEIDTRGFAGTVFGKDSDYFMNPTLKRAVLAEGQAMLAEANRTKFTGMFMYYTLFWLRYKNAVKQVVGERDATAEELGSLALVLGTTPEEWSSGVFPFRREYTWNFSKAFSAGQIELARRMLRANFPATATPATKQSPSPQSAVTVLKSSAGHSALRQALETACIAPDDAATKYLAYALSGTGLAAASVHLEMSELQGIVDFHLRPDLSNAISVGEVLKHGGMGLGEAYTERDVNGVVTGNGIVSEERPMINYINSYFHGELCRNQ